MRHMLALFVFCCVNAGVFACDRDAAVGAMTNIKELARVTETGGTLRFEWGPVLDNQSADRRMRFVRIAADADACLIGRAREHRHFLNGRFFAVASPSSGIRAVQ